MSRQPSRPTSQPPLGLPLGLWSEALRNIRPNRLSHSGPNARIHASAAHGLAHHLEGQAWRRSAVLIKHDAHASVWKFVMGDRPLILKLRALDTWDKRLKASLHLDQHDRHVRSARKFTASGLKTAAPLFFAQGQIGPVPCSILVLEYLSGPTLLESIAQAHSANLPIPDQHAIARAAGTLVADLARAGLGNRDHKPSNIILVRPPDTRAGIEPELAVIDLVGIRRAVGPDRMLASMFIEPLGCGVPPRRALMASAIRATLTRLIPPAKSTALSRRFVFRALWKCAAKLVRNHGNPTPKLNPLRPKLNGSPYSSSGT